LRGRCSHGAQFRCAQCLVPVANADFLVAISPSEPVDCLTVAATSVPNGKTAAERNNHIMRTASEPAERNAASVNVLLAHCEDFYRRKRLLDRGAHDLLGIDSVPSENHVHKHNPDNATRSPVHPHRHYGPEPSSRVALSE
jgi:hypothetical protein